MLISSGGIRDQQKYIFWWRVLKNTCISVDTHGHGTFEKMYSCFAAYVGRERGNGYESANQYRFDTAQCRKEYHETLVQGNISCSQVSASTILRSFLRHQTVGKIRSVFDVIMSYEMSGKYILTTFVSHRNHPRRL